MMTKEADKNCTKLSSTNVARDLNAHLEHSHTVDGDFTAYLLLSTNIDRDLNAHLEHSHTVDGDFGFDLAVSFKYNINN